MTPPAISIVVRAYNNPEELEKTLHSVLRQTLNNFEVVIIDDGLAARANEVVRRFNDSRFRYIAHSLSRGVASTWNTGVRSARAPYIAFLDASDEWMPEKLARQYQALNKASDDIGFSFTGVVDQNGSTTRIQSGSEEGASYEILLKNFKSFFTSTVMVRASAFKNVGYFDETFPTLEHIDLALRLLKTYRFLFIPAALSLIRTQALSVGTPALVSRIRGREMILAKHRAVFEHFPLLYADHFSVLGRWCREAGDIVKAKHYFIRAFRLSHNPRHLLGAFLINGFHKEPRHRQPHSVSQTPASGKPASGEAG